jgi:hypothetical protein
MSIGLGYMSCIEHGGGIARLYMISMVPDLGLMIMNVVVRIYTLMDRKNCLTKD